MAVAVVVVVVVAVLVVVMAIVIVVAVVVAIVAVAGAAATGISIINPRHLLPWPVTKEPDLPTPCHPSAHSFPFRSAGMTHAVWPGPQQASAG